MVRIQCWSANCHLLSHLCRASLASLLHTNKLNNLPTRYKSINNSHCVHYILSDQIEPNLPLTFKNKSINKIKTTVHMGLKILPLLDEGPYYNRPLTGYWISTLHFTCSVQLIMSSKINFLKICTWWPLVTLTWFWPPVMPKMLFLCIATQK